VLEGLCPAELGSNPNENTPEPANQGLTRQTRIFQVGLLELVVAKLYRTECGRPCSLFVLAMLVAGEHSLNKQSRLITCTIKARI
jgi:hypothetical protein